MLPVRARPFAALVAVFSVRACVPAAGGGGHMKGRERCCTSAHGHATGTRAQGVSRARGPGVPSLDQDGNKSMERVSYLVVGCGCRSWWCDRCGPKLGRALRDRLLSEVETWTTCIPMTLTLGRWVGDGDAAAAWEFVTKREKIRKLMEAIGAERWVWFLEPQSDGYPHWHVLVDVPSAATREGLAELRRRVWSLWGPSHNRETGEPTKRPGRWDLGIVEIDRNKLAGQGPRAVVAYCTSYVTKAGDVAAWMLDAEREVRVRKFGASRSVGALRAVGACMHSGEDEGRCVEGEGPERRYRSLRDRLAQCGLRSQVIRETVDTHGAVRRVSCGSETNRKTPATRTRRLAISCSRSISQAGARFARRSTTSDRRTGHGEAVGRAENGVGFRGSIVDGEGSGRVPRRGVSNVLPSGGRG
ncbi:MAG TPA: hypothetical protein PLU35_14210 [Phycisphaerales bacterium]|nr:hypothetical protein [Phycisphaerales bacterium]